MWIMAILNLDSIATTAAYIWTILAYNFILALNTLPWHRISQKMTLFIKIILKLTQIPNFQITYLKIIWKVKGKIHINFENFIVFILKKTKSKHPKNLFFGDVNINSIRSKFESVQEIIKNTFDIFLLSETKIDSSFPNQ